MKKFLACLALAAILALAVTLPASAMKLVEQGESQDSGQKASSAKETTRSPSGTIRTEDGKEFVVPAPKEKPETGKDGGAKGK